MKFQIARYKGFKVGIFRNRPFGNLQEVCYILRYCSHVTFATMPVSFFNITITCYAICSEKKKLYKI